MTWYLDLYCYMSFYDFLKLSYCLEDYVIDFVFMILLLLLSPQYMDKPPKGKHSTKGLGKNVPLESEFVKWKDEVVVPCGRPVPSSVRASELLYNEYIVYDTSQVGIHLYTIYTSANISYSFAHHYSFLNNNPWLLDRSRCSSC